MTGREQATIAGTPIDRCDLEQAVDRLLRGDLAGGALVVTPNVSIVRQLERSPRPELLGDNTMWLLDGRPLQILLRLRGHSGYPRVTGADLLPALAESAAAAGLPVLIMGASAPAAAESLSKTVQGSSIRGFDLPFAPIGDPALLAAAMSRLPEEKCVLFLCLGFPKQEALALQIRRARPEVIVAGVGAAAQMLSGESKRAPLIVQNLSLEWAWRMAQDPRRLIRRYIIEDLPWLIREAVRILTHRIRGRSEETR